MEVDDLTPFFSVGEKGSHESLAKYFRLCISIYHINVYIYIYVYRYNQDKLIIYIEVFVAREFLQPNIWILPVGLKKFPQCTVRTSTKLLLSITQVKFRRRRIVFVQLLVGSINVYTGAV